MRIHHNLLPTLSDIIPQLGLSRTLTRREKQCLLLSSQGKSIKEIANCMGITIHTVKLHKRNICIKLNCSNMNQAIAASVNSYFDYLMLIPGNVYWKDLKGVYLGCNLSMLDMVGLSSIQDVVGKTDYDLSWSESAGVLQKNDREVIRSEKLHSFEESTIFDNGSIITMISNKIPLVAKSGEVIGIIGSSIDISSLKKPAIPASCFEKSNGRESGQN